MTRVLVIDDELIVRMSCERTLSEAGYNVRSASGGKEGLELLEKDNYDLLLLDLKMPDMDGLEVLRVLRNRWPDTKVIIITGYGTDQTSEQTQKEGAHNFLEKPFTPDSLLSITQLTLQQ